MDIQIKNFKNSVSVFLSLFQTRFSRVLRLLSDMKILMTELLLTETNKNHFYRPIVTVAIVTCYYDVETNSLVVLFQLFFANIQGIMRIPSKIIERVE